MVTGRRITAGYEDENFQWPRSYGNGSITNRNLRKSDLGGVIFGCKHETMTECLSKQLFGLPHAHFSYVINIREGLPLFLFNYSDRKLHGIFEAASDGHMSYDAYAWTNGGAERTPYPAQVYIRIRKQCQPLSENQFSTIIEDNYYNPYHFWFELDHAQTRTLISLFKPSAPNFMWSPIVPSRKELFPIPNPNLAIKYSPLSRKEPFTAVPATEWKATANQESITDIVNDNKFASAQCNLGDKASSSGFEDSTISDWEDLVEDNVKNTSSGASSQLDGSSTKGFNSSGAGSQLDGSSTNGTEKEEERVLCLLEKLAAERAISKSFPNKEENVSRSDRDHTNDKTKGVWILSNTNHDNVEHVANSSTHELNHENAELVQAINELKERTSKFEKQRIESDKEIKQLRNEVKDSGSKIQLLRGRVEELESMIVACNSLVYDSLDRVIEQKIGSEEVIYLIGGYNGCSWLSSLESFSPEHDILTPLKSMSYDRAYASSVALDGTLYVFGGGDGSLWYDSVEFYDRRRDEWTECSSMLREKGSLAGAVVHGKIFAIGGGDGAEWFSDVEMFDPALGRWIMDRSMLDKRFAPAAAQLEGVIYATGGYNGNEYLRSVERFDPREGLWTELPSMNVRRGCHSLAVFNEKLYSIGGYDGDNMVSSMEIFDPRLNYWVMGEPMSSNRGFAAATVLGNSLIVVGGIADEQAIVDSVECYREGAGWTNSGWKAIGDRCFCSAVVL